MPTTMLGTPASTSAVKRTGAVSFELAPYSARNTPASKPLGIPTALAITISTAVPTRPLSIPPGYPCAPYGIGTLLKNDQLTDRHPIDTRYPTTSTRIARIPSVNATHSPYITRLVARAIGLVEPIGILLPWHGL